MRILTPAEAKFFYRAICVKPVPGARLEVREVFEFFLPSNDTSEAIKEIESEGWIIIESSCTESRGR
jgi:hypothetical protein